VKSSSSGSATTSHTGTAMPNRSSGLPQPTRSLRRSDSSSPTRPVQHQEVAGQQRQVKLIESRDTSVACQK
jgi:hypothetical protein